VVGARGFIGRALCAKFDTLNVPALPLDRGDLDSPDAVVRIGECRTIYWAASTINPAIAVDEPERVAVDQAAFSAFLDLLAKLASPPQVVLLSSGGTVYGRDIPPFTEDTPARPDTAYGRAKLDLERELSVRPLPQVIARISNAYGPGQRPARGQGVIGYWLSAVAARRPLRVIGSLDVVRDYLYIDDLVTALVALHEPDNSPNLLNLASGVPTTLREVLATIASVTGVERPKIELVPQRDFDLDEVWLDATLAYQTLGWKPQTNLATGIAATWDWVVSTNSTSGG